MHEIPMDDWRLQLRTITGIDWGLRNLLSLLSERYPSLCYEIRFGMFDLQITRISSPDVGAFFC